MKINKILASVLIAVAFFPIGADNLTASELKKIKVQTYYPASMALGIESFTAEVNKKLQDKVEVSVFFGNSLLSSATLMDGIRKNIMPIGQMITHMYPQIKSGKLLAGMPLITDNAKEAELLFDKYGLFEFAQTELAKFNLVYLGPTWSAPYHFVSKRPINSLEDLKGMRIRAIGATADMLNKLGITTINVPPESLYMALQNGEIDGAIFGSAYDYQQAGLFEVAPWYNTTPLLCPVFDSLVVSKKTWDTLSAEEQNVFLTAAKNARWTWYDEVMKQEEVLKNTIFKGKTTAFSESDIEQFNNAALAVLSDQALESPDTAKGVAIFRKFMEENNK